MELGAYKGLCMGNGCKPAVGARGGYINKPGEELAGLLYRIF